MKKIIIVTLFDEFNIGNRLQNFALQNILESYGFDVITLDNGYSHIFSIRARIKLIIKKLLVNLGNKKYAEECRRYDHLNKTRKKIKKFNRRNISNQICCSNQGFFEMDWSSYDLAIAGSDQIWHKWRDDENELPYYYLQFMPPEKRVAYAASFGFESFPKSDIEQHRAGLQGMKEISCREENGCELVESLTGKKAIRVLDPTLLLSADGWRELENQATNVIKEQGKYAFVFFLGSISEDYKKYIAETMRKNGIENLVDFHDKKMEPCGPCEFISLIDHAEFIFTDSFHCTVFSTIFNKKFTAFRRVQPGFEKMFGRIEDLLASTNKLDCIYGGTQKLPTNNFDELYHISIGFFDRILRILDEN